ncbi:Amidohydro-rel domain-containing protein [Mycena sanguinolenta]|uniref:Amidohydro-rel domain-containing protein n=1 Tax=Mycena sanguinolenta TaxID=230812 RepID=A0A8H6U2X4_9AGAR|nr:Amidohydro-rel domain-containing protein [Mycena sanguinolenta]
MAAAAQPFTIIDDQDASVKYTGTWAWWEIIFSVPFTGTAIAVYGTFDSSSAGVQTSYAIDGGTPVTVTSTSSPNDSYQQLFWQSDAVSSGAHNLVVTMVAVNSGDGDGEGTIWFDYFNVTTADDAASNASNTVSNTSSGTKSASPETKTASTTGTSSSTPSSTGTVTAGKSSHTSAIAGAIAGIVVILIIAGTVFRRRRRAARQYIAAPLPSSSSNGPPPTEPFLPNQPTMTPMSGLPGSAPVAASYGAPAGAPYNPGGFDPRQTYALSAPGPFEQGNAYVPVPAPGFPSAVPYDPYAPVGSAMLQADNPAPQSSYAPSVSSIPSSSRASRGPLTVVGGSSTTPDPSDSVAELKRRQQQVVNQYEQGISGSAPVIQHTDSGMRALDSGAGPAPTELPPVYTAT